MKNLFITALSVWFLSMTVTSVKAAVWSDCTEGNVPDSQMEGICTTNGDHSHQDDGSTFLIGDAELENGEIIHVVAIQEPGGTATILARVFVRVQGSLTEIYKLYSSYDSTGRISYSDYPEIFSTDSLGIISQIERRLYGPDPRWETFNAE